MTYYAHRDVLSKNKVMIEDILKAKRLIDLEIKELEKINKKLQEILTQQHFTKESFEKSLKIGIERANFIIKSYADFERYKEILFKNPSKSFNEERTLRRELAYSIFHRSFSKNCYTIDLDFLEIRVKNKKLEPVLLYDLKHNLNIASQNIDWNKYDSLPIKMYFEVAKKLNIPFWVVNCDKNITRLKVDEICNLNPLKILTNYYTPLKYKEKIESL